MERKGDVLYGVIDQETGEWFNFKKVITWIDGTTMNSLLVDSVIYIEVDGEFFKRSFSGPVNPFWFGAKGDGITDDTAAIQKAIDIFQTGSLIDCGITIRFERGTYLVANLILKNGIKLYADQNPKDNYISNVSVKIAAYGSPDFIIDTAVGATNWCIAGLYIEGNGNFGATPNMIACVRLRGVKGYFIDNNINAAPQTAVWSEAGLVFIERNGIYGFYGDVLPVFSGINDFRGALHVPAFGDAYIKGNEIGAGLDYFTSTVIPRDPVNGRIVCLALGAIFGGTGWIGENFFENGDRAVAIGNSLYCEFYFNRYELSAMGGLYIFGPMQYATFTCERFSGNSLSVDGIADDITIGIGAAGNISFLSPTFEALANVSIPNSTFQVRYHISNYGSTKIDIITPLIDTAYSTSGLVNLVDIGTLPIRQVKGQYDPNNPLFDSVSTQKLPAETQVGFTKITQGTDVDTQSLIGAIQFWTPEATIAYSIGFSPKEYLSFIGYDPAAIFAFNSSMALQKTGAATMTIWSTDALGNSQILLQGGESVTSQTSLVLNNTTNTFTITSSGDIVFGINENYRLKQNGTTFIIFPPTPGTISDSFLLGRNTTTGEQTKIDPAIFFNITTVQTAHTVYAGPTAGSPVAPIFRLLVAGDIPVLDANKITTGTIVAARLGSGTPSSTTALFGDQTYKTVLTDSAAFINNQSATDILSSFRTQGTASIVPLAVGGGFKVSATSSQLTIESGGVALARVQMFTDGVSIVQLRVFDAFNKGFVYEGNYAAAGILDDRWIPDYKAVKDYVTSVSTGGTVTSVGLSLPSIFSVSGSPVTSTGILTGSLATQLANLHFIGPTSGSAAIPTFRALVALDLGTGTASSATYLAGDMTWKTTPLGSVTSVALSLPSIFSISGSPITTSGTLTGTLTTQTANTIFGGPPTGIATTPTFRALVAADIPSLPFSQITGTVPTTQGGTGLITIGSSLQQVRVNAGGSALEYFTSTDIASLNGLTTTSQTFALDQLNTAPTWTSAAGVHTLSLPLAGTGATSGMLSNTTQNIAGSKTFTTSIIASAGIQTGVTATSSNLYANVSGSGIAISSGITGLAIGGVATASKTWMNGVTSTTPAVNANFSNVIVGAGGWTTAASGTHVIGASLSIKAPLVTLGTATVTDLATAYFESGATAVSGNGWNILVGAGPSQIRGTLSTSGGIWTGASTSASTAYSNSNLGVFGGDGSSASSTASILIGAASTMNYRAVFNGVGTSTIAGVGNSIANVILGSAANTTAGSGTHAIAANLAIKAPTLTIGTATITNATTLYIDASPTTGVTNSALLIAAGDSRIQNLYATTPAYTTGGYTNIVRNATTGRFENASANVLIVATATDANYTIPDGSGIVILPVITANRTTTLPTLQIGQVINIHNRNSAGFNWSFTNGNVKDAAGSTITNLVNQSMYQFYYDGTNLYKMN